MFRVRRAFVAAAASMCAIGTMLAVAVSPAAADPFLTLAPGFTQELYATDLPFATGIAFATDGDGFAAFNEMYRIDQQTTVSQNGSTYHPTSPFPASGAVGLGLVNGPNGNVYANTTSGVQELDPTTGVPIGGPIGSPGDSYGITVDPQTGNLVYSSATNIMVVSPSGAVSGIYSAVGRQVDGLAFDPTGTYLFAATQPSVAVINRAGVEVQSIALTTPGSHGPDGMAFHAGDPKFLVSVNNSGDITRFDFPAGNYAQAPTQSVFASGGFRGDLTQVGSDGCLYASQQFTRFADGATSSAGSIARICSGFIPPVTIPTTLVAHGYLPSLRPSATLTAQGSPLAGKAITFTAGGQTICTATTNTSGLARCPTPLAGLLGVITAGGYRATFDGDGPYQASTDTAGLL
jgi:streptogramin lyase